MAHKEWEPIAQPEEPRDNELQIGIPEETVPRPVQRPAYEMGEDLDITPTDLNESGEDDED